MSPAAAELASACSAPGPPADDVVVAVVAAFTVVVGAVAVPDPAVCFEPPQPATIRPNANRMRAHRDRRQRRPILPGAISPGDAATDRLRILKSLLPLGSSGHPVGHR